MAAQGRASTAAGVPVLPRGEVGGFAPAEERHGDVEWVRAFGPGRHKGGDAGEEAIGGPELGRFEPMQAQGQRLRHSRAFDGDGQIEVGDAPRAAAASDRVAAPGEQLVGDSVRGEAPFVDEKAVTGLACAAQLLSEPTASKTTGDPLKRNRNSSTPPVEALSC